MSARHKKVRKNSILVANRYAAATLSLGVVLGIGAVSAAPAMANGVHGAGVHPSGGSGRGKGAGDTGDGSQGADSSTLAVVTTKVRNEVPGSGPLIAYTDDSKGAQQGTAIGNALKTALPLLLEKVMKLPKVADRSGYAFDGNSILTGLSNILVDNGVTVIPSDGKPHDVHSLHPLSYTDMGNTAGKNVEVTLVQMVNNKPKIVTFNTEGKANWIADKDGAHPEVPKGTAQQEGYKWKDPEKSKDEWHPNHDIAKSTAENKTNSIVFAYASDSTTAQWVDFATDFVKTVASYIPGFGTGIGLTGAALDLFNSFAKISEDNGVKILKPGDKVDIYQPLLTEEVNHFPKTLGDRLGILKAVSFRFDKFNGTTEVKTSEFNGHMNDTFLIQEDAIHDADNPAKILGYWGIPDFVNRVAETIKSAYNNDLITEDSASVSGMSLPTRQPSLTRAYSHDLTLDEARNAIKEAAFEKNTLSELVLSLHEDILTSLQDEINKNEEIDNHHSRIAKRPLQLMVLDAIEDAESIIKDNPDNGNLITRVRSLTKKLDSLLSMTDGTGYRGIGDAHYLDTGVSEDVRKAARALKLHADEPQDSEAATATQKVINVARKRADNSLAAIDYANVVKSREALKEKTTKGVGRGSGGDYRRDETNEEMEGRLAAEAEKQNVPIATYIANSLKQHKLTPAEVKAEQPNEAKQLDSDGAEADRLMADVKNKQRNRPADEQYALSIEKVVMKSVADGGMEKNEVYGDVKVTEKGQDSVPQTVWSESKYKPLDMWEDHEFPLLQKSFQSPQGFSINFNIQDSDFAPFGLSDDPLAVGELSWHKGDALGWYIKTFEYRGDVIEVTFHVGSPLRDAEKREIGSGGGQSRKRSVGFEPASAPVEIAELNSEKKPDSEADRKAKEEADRKAKEEADRKAKEEADRKAKEEADRKAKEEADRKAKEEADRKAKEEADRKAKEEADRKAKEEADRKAKEEADRKAKEEADRKAKEEADRKAKEEADRKAREEADRRAREEADRRAEDHRREERR